MALPALLLGSSGHSASLHGLPLFWSSARMCTEMCVLGRKASVFGTVSLPGQVAYKQEEQDASDE